MCLCPEQGWLKGVNSNTLDPVRDMGKDGAEENGLHQFFPKDVFGFSLNYFDTDYTPVGTTQFLADNSFSQFPLFNGNISGMVTALHIFDEQSNPTPQPLLYHYRYDQLNRLVSANSLFSEEVIQTNDWSGAANPSNALNTSFSYDPNGNILTLERKGTEANPDMDDLIYHYSNKDNRLQYVTDLVNSVYDTDIDNQNPHNYTYDQIGNLIADEAEEISMINWTVYGKVSKILSYNESKPTIYFKYDASGNRVSKTTIDINGFVTTFYVRDAQGNVLTTYDYRYQQPIMISEQMIYGSSRIGLWERLRQEISQPETGPAPPDDSPPIDDPGVDPGNDEPVALSFEHVSGLKRYELTNHLGNVLTTVSDRKLYSALNGNTADIISAQDYYPFGSLMPGRNWNSGGYRFGYGGHEKVDEVSGSGNTVDMGDRWLDVRLGRTPKTDKRAKEFPDLSPYSYAGNSPILFIDRNGEKYLFTIKIRTGITQPMNMVQS